MRSIGNLQTAVSPLTSEASYYSIQPDRGLVPTRLARFMLVFLIVLLGECLSSGFLHLG